MPLSLMQAVTDCQGMGSLAPLALSRHQHEQTHQTEKHWGMQVLFHRAIKTRRFESLSMQDITQFLIVGLLCGALQQWSPPGGPTSCCAFNTCS